MAITNNDRLAASQARLQQDKIKRAAKLQRDKDRIQKALSEGLRGGPFGGAGGMASLKSYKKLMDEYKKLGETPEGVKTRRENYLAKCLSGVNGLQSTDPRWKNRKQIGGKAEDDNTKLPPKTSFFANKNAELKARLEVSAAANREARRIRLDKLLESAIPNLESAAANGWLWNGAAQFKFTEPSSATDKQAQVDTFFNTQAKMSWITMRIAYNRWLVKTGQSGLVENIQLVSTYHSINFLHVFALRDSEPSQEYGRELRDFPYEYRFTKVGTNAYNFLKYSYTWKVEDSWFQ